MIWHRQLKAWLCPMREVVITGIGLRTPMGDEYGSVMQGMAQGRSAISLDPQQQRAMARVTTALDAGFSRQQLNLYDRVSQLGVLAADAAFADAGWQRGSLDGARSGVFLGNGCGPTHAVMDAYQTMFQTGSMRGLVLLRCLPNAAASHISMQWNIRGACQTYALACASAAAALGEAMRAIRHGYLDLAVAGGSEAPFGEGTYSAWEAMRVLAPVDEAAPQRMCRPFAHDRSGIVLGEGAVFFVLEEEQAARARGARIHARLSGYGVSADADHLTSPSPENQARAMQHAMQDAQVCASDIAYVNAHGTATKVGDVSETKALHHAFGAHAPHIPVSSTKAMHGHLLGASAGIELLACLLALQQGILAPTLNLDQADPECDLDYVPNQARSIPLPAAVMSNSFAFGGSNASLILCRA